MKKLLEELKDTLKINQGADWTENNPAQEFEALEEMVQGIIDSIPDPRIVNASHYLCYNGSEGELTIEEQVKALENHPDPTDWASCVEGVLPWEAVENYTVENILELL